MRMPPSLAKLAVFLGLGLGVFALERWVRGAGDPESRRIDVGAAEIARLAGLWQTQAQRPPSAAELAGLIDDHVREEILYREALRLGLDRDDTIVRRRLAQKMSFMISDTARIPEPTADELLRFFEEHADRYREPGRTSFVHVYYSREVRGEEAALAAGRDLAALGANGAADEEWRRMGDPFMLQREYAERSERELSELFGGGFARGLAELPTGEWSGPLASAFGVHLVRVLTRSAPGQPDLAQVRSRVLEDYRATRHREANEAAYESLHKRYRVTVERIEGFERDVPGSDGSTAQAEGGGQRP